MKEKHAESRMRRVVELRRELMAGVAVALGLAFAVAAASFFLRSRFLRTIFRHGGVVVESESNTGRHRIFRLPRLTLARRSPQTATTQRLAGNAQDWGELAISKQGLHVGITSDTSYHSQELPVGDVLFASDKRVESRNNHGTLEWRLRMGADDTECNPPAACKA